MSRLQGFGGQACVFGAEACRRPLRWQCRVPLLLQVHAAVLKGSRKDVVIKVLKPGVEDVLTVDLNMIYIGSRVLEFLR